MRTAILRTLDGIAANEWHVESPSGEAPDAARIVRGPGPAGRRATARRWGPSTGAGQFAGPPSARAGSGSPGQARALVVPHASDDATVLEVRAQDRPGLLHELGRHLRQGRPLGALAPTSPRMPGRPSTRSTSPSSAAGCCRPARVAQAVSSIIDTCDGASG